MASPDPIVVERQMYLTALGIPDDPMYTLAELREKTGGGARVDLAARVGNKPPVPGLTYYVDDFKAMGDGVTNDSAAIKKANDALKALGGGRLVFSPNKTYLVDKVDVYSNVEYYGFGSTLKCVPNPLFGIFHSAGVVIDRAWIRGFRLDGGQTAQRGVYVDTASNVSVEFNYIFNFGNLNSQGGIRFGPDSYQCNAEFNTIVGPVDVPHGTVTEFVGIMANSIPPDPQGGGNNSNLTFSTATNLSQKHVIKNNFIYNGKHNITLYAAQHCSVYDNWCYGGSERGIIMSPIAIGNIIHNNHIMDAVSTGIHMAWGCKYNSITNNTCITTTSAIEGSGIKGYYGCNDNTITNNYVEGTADYAYAVLFGCSRNIITDNRANNCNKGFVVLTAYTAANGNGLGYSIPTAMPDSDSNVIKNNIAQSCGIGYWLDATDTANNTNTVLADNVALSCTTPYKISENSGRQVKDVVALNNVGGPWTLARGERHFALKSSNTQLPDTPKTNYFIAGEYYACTPAGVTTTQQQSNAAGKLTQLRVPNKITVSEFAAEITTAGSTGSVLRLGIYSSNQSGKPDILVYDGGTVSGEVAGMVFWNPAGGLVLNPGTYWIGVYSQGAPTTQPTLRAITPAMQLDYISAIPVTMNGARPGAGQGTSIGWVFTAVAGALPATAGPPAFYVQDASRIFMKV